MSSRVRLMLQDFGNGTAKTGKAAYAQLQELYQNWEKSAAKGGTKTKLFWRRTTEEYASAHPFTCTRYHARPKNQDVAWEGPGYYLKTYDAVPEPGRRVPPLPAGARWQVAREMWSRVQDTYAGGFRLFISRDNRKHAWRKSLCNPWHQQFGWKARKPLPKKVKKGGGKSTTVITRNYTAPWDDGSRYELPSGLRQGRAPEQTKPAAVKPRVGIWS